MTDKIQVFNELAQEFFDTGRLMGMDDGSVQCHPNGMIIWKNELYSVWVIYNAFYGTTEVKIKMHGSLSASETEALSCLLQNIATFCHTFDNKRGA